MSKAHQTEDLLLPAEAKKEKCVRVVRSNCPLRAGGEDGETRGGRVFKDNKAFVYDLYDKCIGPVQRNMKRSEDLIPKVFNKLEQSQRRGRKQKTLLKMTQTIENMLLHVNNKRYCKPT